MDAPRRVVLATGNAGKLREFAALLAPLGFDVLPQVQFGIDPPPETGDTFEANALIKARHASRIARLPALADDSGIEVDALGGRPGVHSARYAGEGGTRAERDRANNDKLLGALAALPPEVSRKARFVCAMCLVDAEGLVLFETRGTYEGIITDAPRGDNGFGYDPLLLLPDLGKTSAELSRSSATRG